MPDYNALKSHLRGDLIQPGDGNYDEARKLYNAMIDKKPAAIARCVDVADVMACVNHARSNGILLAVRGGGHNGPGLGSCDGGLVIDLSRMRGVRVDPAHGYIPLSFLTVHPMNVSGGGGGRHFGGPVGTTPPMLSSGDRTPAGLENWLQRRRYWLTGSHSGPQALARNPRRIHPVRDFGYYWKGVGRKSNQFATNFGTNFGTLTR